MQNFKSKHNEASLQMESMSVGISWTGHKKNISIQMALGLYSKQLVWATTFTRWAWSFMFADSSGCLKKKTSGLWDIMIFKNRSLCKNKIFHTTFIFSWLKNELRYTCCILFLWAREFVLSIRMSYTSDASCYYVRNINNKKQKTCYNLNKKFTFIRGQIIQWRNLALLV